MKNKFKEFMNILNKKEMLYLPGNLAYFFVLSIVPVVTLILFVATSFNLSFSIITDFIEVNFSKEIVDLIMPILEENDFSLGMFIYLIIAFVLASNGSHSIIVTSNTLFNVESSDILKRRVKSFVLTFFVIILFTFILVVPLFGAHILNFFSYIGVNNSILTFFKILYPVLNVPLSLFVIFFFVKLVYTIAPDEKIPSKYVNKGAIFTTISWTFITIIYSYYIKHFALYGKFYAGLANIIALMLWFYLLAFVFTIGISINYSVSRKIIERNNNEKFKEMRKKIVENKLIK